MVSSNVKQWPVVKGDYVVGDETSNVAVVTLASSLEPSPRAAIWGTCMTENLGVEKVIINVVSNPHIRYVVVCGMESKGHLPGDAIVSIHKNGVDERRRIVDSKGAIPYIENVPLEAIERFRKQVEIINMIGEIDTDKIHNLVDRLSRSSEEYPEEPIFCVAPSTSDVKIEYREGDVFVCDDVYIDSTVGVVIDVQI